MNRLRYVIKAAAFLTVLCLCLGFFSVLLTPKYYQEDIYPTTSTFCEFYQLEKNSVDVLFLGSSHAVTAFDPCVLYENWGLTSYNLGSEQQSLLISYYWLKEALRYQMYEPYLIQLGFIARTPRGRIVLPRGYSHMGYTPPMDSAQQKMEI